MQKELYFEKVNQIGNLYLECILYEFEYEPILFVCSDELNNLYLCACSEMRKEQRWLITNTDYNILHALTTHKIDIKTAMTAFCNQKYIITRGLDCKETSLPILINDINLQDIPKENVYLNYFNKEITEEFLKKISEEDVYKEFKDRIINVTYINDEYTYYNCKLKIEMKQFHYEDLLKKTEYIQEHIDDFIKYISEYPDIQKYLNDFIKKSENIDYEIPECSSRSSCLDSGFINLCNESKKANNIAIAA